MKRIAALVWAVGLLALAGCGRPAGPPLPPAEPQAAAAVETWLKLVDEGRYAESWSAAAASLKFAVPEGQWVRTLCATRGSSGAVTSRKLVSARPLPLAPGMPPGQYVAIRYQTAFANRPSVNEEVIPVKEADGAWRVSGYQLSQ